MERRRACSGRGGPHNSAIQGLRTSAWAVAPGVNETFTKGTNCVRIAAKSGYYALWLSQLRLDVLAAARGSTMRVSAAIAAFVVSVFWSFAGHALPPHAERDPIQYIAISFDGSRSLEIWEETLAFARKHDVRFTFFLSCTYFLHQENRKLYKAPGRSFGRSGIGFAPDAQNIAARLEQLNLAMAEGHELGSHACGHYDGRRWSEAQWRQEFESFRSILKNAYANNGLEGEPDDWAETIEEEVKGFRAPFLARSERMDKVLAEFGFRYDASRIGFWDAMPERGLDGVWNFPLAIIPEGRSKRPAVISMDYNFYVRHTRGRDKPDRSAEFRRRMYESYKAYFRKNYFGNRAPIHIGHHFSRWNGGAYWDALKDFVKDVCGYSDVRCVTYRELADALDAIELAQNPPADLEIRTLSARED